MIRILVVEDDSKQLKRLKEILERNFPDYHIETAISPQQAVKKINELKAFSLIITDYAFYNLLEGSTEDSEETGYSLLEYCKEHLTDVPVILITAYGKDKEKEVRAALSFQKGVFDYMLKPLDYPEFIERVKRAILISEALA